MTTDRDRSEPVDPRWHRAQEIFAEVIDLSTADRAAEAARLCGDDELLRTFVDRLLAADSEAGSFIEDALSGASQLLGDAVDPVDPILRRRRLGKYEILETVGHGGFGKVYGGRDPDLQRRVAIKTCSVGDRAPLERDLRRRFFREARIAAGLQHPNITTIHDFGIQDGIPFIVQEFLTGEDLDRKIAQRAALATATRLDILTQLARGLAHAHEHGILHRDVKPSNVRILESGRVKILDFGIARVLDPEALGHPPSGARVDPRDTLEESPGQGRSEQPATGPHRLTRDGLAVGTIGYLAPEQLDGGDVDARADIFSFGVLAYELLTYEHPFPGGTRAEISRRLISENPDPLTTHWPRCPPRLAFLVARCLEKERDHRYETFRQILEELAAIAKRSSRARSRTGRGGELGRVRPGRKTRLLSAAALAALLLGAGWIAWSSRTQVSDPVAGLDTSLSAQPEKLAVARTEPVAGPQSLRPARSMDGSGQVNTARRADEAPEVEAPEPFPNAPTADPEHRETVVPELSPDQGATSPSSVQTPSLLVESAPEPPLRTAVAATPPPSPSRGPESQAAARPEGPRSTGLRMAPTLQPTEIRPTALPSNLEDEDPEPTTALSLPTTPRLTSTLQSLVIEPQLLEQPEPRYPSRARKRRLEATVLVAVLVDTDGRVASTLVRQSDDAGWGFDEEARRAALEARFLPGVRDGVAARMWSSLEFDFRLP